MTPQQQRIWLLSQLDQTHHTSVVVSLRGHIETGSFKRCFETIVDRHAVLNSGFAKDGSGRKSDPRSQAAHLGFVDLQAAPDGERENHRKLLITEQLEERFDLENGPLIRGLLLQLGPKDHVLILVAHLIVCDARSIHILLNELLHSYAGVQQESSLGQSAEYEKYVEAQQSYLRGEAFHSDLLYWKRQLEGAPPGVEVALDKTRPAVPNFHGSETTSSLPTLTLAKLKNVHCDFQTALLSAFAILLARYGGVDDVVFGMELSGRSEENSGAVGLLSNTVIMRVDLAGDPSCRELMQRVEMIASEARNHQRLPFGKLVEELHTKPDLSRHPFFQIMFVYNDLPNDLPQLPDMCCEFLYVEKTTEILDLTVRLRQQNNGVEASFSYRNDLFQPSTIQRMMGHFRTLVEGIASNPEQHVSELQLMGREEQHQILTEFNNTAANYRADLCVQDFFEFQASKTPESTALISDQGRLSYSGLNARANQVAHYLRRHGVGPEVLVAICTERSNDMVVGILGILKAGGAYVPLDPAYPKNRLSAILDDAKCPVLLTQKSLMNVLPKHTAAVICLDRDWEKIAQESTENVVSGVKPENLGYVLFTSGSTGRPKGVALEHRSAATFLQWARDVFTPDEIAGTLFSTSMSFDLSVFEMFVPLSMGGKVILAQNALFLPKLTAANEVTLINTVPSAAAELLRVHGIPDSVRVINLAGEALPSTLARQLYEETSVEKVYNLYGPTEDTTYSTYTLVPRSGEVTIGRPLPNTQAYILDSSRRPVPIGIPGELYLAGAGLARGYFGRPDLTAERFFSNPFTEDVQARIYKTGDLARFLENGRIQYLGRTDTQVKLRGFRIELGEIESVLHKYALVSQSVVIVREDSRGDPSIFAYVTASAGRSIDLDNLRNFAKEKLPPYMIPSRFMQLSALPLTPNGKVNRKALPIPPEESPATVGMGPRDELEAKLVKVFEKILGRRSVGIRDDFFELGGHSLMAARLITEIERVTGKEISLSVFFSAASVESLARVLSQDTQSGPEPLAMQIQAGASPIFFLIVPPGESAVGYAVLARHMGDGQKVYKIQEPTSITSENQRPYTNEEMDELAKKYADAMRDVAPSGPYYLGGMCDGAHIGLRVAHHLESQGQKIGMFAIFDTWVLENSLRPLLWNVYYYFERIHDAWKLGVLEKLRLAFKSLRNAVTRRGRTAWEEAYWPSKGFVPTTIRGSVTVFKRPKQPYFYVRDPHMGWGSRALGGVDIQVVAIRHAEMLREPHVKILAKHLIARLQQSYREHSASEDFASEPHITASASQSSQAAFENRYS